MTVTGTLGDPGPPVGRWSFKRPLLGRVLSSASNSYTFNCFMYLGSK
jgi:hypothetical protein